MPPAASVEPTLLEALSSVASSPERSVSDNRRFGDLRGVQWRIDLGILPSSSSSSIDDLRRVTADSRRSYAALRRRLLVDLHIPKDESNFSDLVMDNPLSQNPDSMWGRFFQKAELEKMLDQDLSRLYPEHGSYFQTPGCQSMLRRILLLWCIRHPNYGYRQGMHELLAPLLYVLQEDIKSLSEVRKLHEDHFTDIFDVFSFHENDLSHKFDLKKFSDSMENEIGPPKSPSLNELDPKIQAIVLLSDAYGAEGELGIVLSEKFMEHDAYCMFDALMNGAGGAVAMAHFFSPSPLAGPQTGLPPVIEASSALYHLLSIVDSSLYSHLVELGVEPQYFALRWLRVLFGREFALEDLLIIWDEIFAADNSQLNKLSADDTGFSSGTLNSSRGAFISALAVSMLLYLRSSLLATENAASCLQRLLNFPDDVNLKKLIAKAKSLVALAIDASNFSPLPVHAGTHDQSKSVAGRIHSLSLDSTSPGSPLSLVPESYWEEKWRVLHKEEPPKQGSLQKQVSNRIKGWSDKVKLRLSRTESDPSPSKADRKNRDPRSSVRRSLLEDLAKQLGEEEDVEKLVRDEDSSQKGGAEVVDGQDESEKNFTCRSEERCLSGNAGSEENSSIFSSPSGGANDQENDSERSSVASNLSVDENDVEPNNAESCSSNHDASPLPISDAPEEVLSLKSGHSEDSTMKSGTNLKERKSISGRFPWFWKFGRNGSEGTLEKGCFSEVAKASVVGCNHNNAGGSSTTDGFNSTSIVGKGDAVDQHMMGTLKNLGQSMLENIQVIESVFQPDKGQAGPVENYSKNALVERGQVTAMAALKELRKISNLLSEM